MNLASKRNPSFPVPSIVYLHLLQYCLVLAVWTVYIMHTFKCTSQHSRFKAIKVLRFKSAAPANYRNSLLLHLHVMKKAPRLLQHVNQLLDPHLLLHLHPVSILASTPVATCTSCCISTFKYTCYPSCISPLLHEPP